jgi:hypothetical protein
MLKVRLYLNGARVKTRRELPPEWRGRVRRRQRLARQERRRIRCGGVNLAAAAVGTPPGVSLHTATGTETIPGGLTNMAAEVWAGGGGGGDGAGTGCAATGGGGGGSGSYGYLSAFTVTGQGGHTLSCTVGTGGVNQTTGIASSIAAGTITGWTSITTNPGTGGNGTAAGTGGAAGTGPGTNTAGNNGTVGGTGSRGSGGAGVAGNITGDGGPYGAGGRGSPVGTGNHGLSGSTGAACFRYT